VRTAFAVVAALVTSGCELTSIKWTSDVTFELDRRELAVGESVEVKFSVRVEDGRHWWIALVPEDRPFDDPRDRVAIPKGAKTIRVVAEHEGRCEVRVYHDPQGTPAMVARAKVRVR